ncbi:unnamed protein product [Peniophora sp. CBMAI 1063]|nr:unnamed protein product [Peniophora sp. CBMAI 1063]
MSDSLLDEAAAGFFEELQVPFPVLSEPDTVSHVELITDLLVATVIYAAVFQRTYAYIVATGAKGTALKTVSSLWLMSTAQYLHVSSSVFIVYMYTSETPPPLRRVFFKTLGAYAFCNVIGLIIVIRVAVVTWKQLYTITGRSKLYACTLILSLLLPSIWLPDYEALICPSADYRSECPRLRMPSQLRDLIRTQRQSRIRSYFIAAVMMALNYLLLNGLFMAINALEDSYTLPGGPYITFQNVYALAYLIVKTRNAEVPGRRDEVAEEQEQRRRPAAGE